MCSRYVGAARREGLGRQGDDIGKQDYAGTGTSAPTTKGTRASFYIAREQRKKKQTAEGPLSAVSSAMQRCRSSWTNCWRSGKHNRQRSSYTRELMAQRKSVTEAALVRATALVDAICAPPEAAINTATERPPALTLLH